MANSRILKTIISRPFFYIILIAIVGFYIYRDHNRLVKDVINIQSLFYNVRVITERDQKTLKITFSENGNILVKDGATDTVKSVLQVPTLKDYYFDKNTIAFTNGIPENQNKVKNFGTILLKSSFGFKRRLKMDSKGVIVEIPYEDEKERPSE